MAWVQNADTWLKNHSVMQVYRLHNLKQTIATNLVASEGMCILYMAPLPLALPSTTLVVISKLKFSNVSKTASSSIFLFFHTPNSP